MSTTNVKIDELSSKISLINAQITVLINDLGMTNKNISEIISKLSDLQRQIDEIKKMINDLLITPVELKYKFVDPNYIFIGEYNKKKYFLSKNRDSWINAFKFSLADENLSLVNIENQETLNFLKTNIASNINKVNYFTGEKIVHIGLRYNKTDGKFYWQNGKLFTNQQWFMGGHPEQSTLDNNINIGAFMYWDTGAISESYDLASWWHVLEETPYNVIPELVAASQPYAYFSLKIDNSCISVNSPITFINQSLRGDRFSWQFSDGQTSTEKSPIKSFSNSDGIKITLTTSNASGSSTYETYLNFKCPIDYRTFQNVNLKLFQWNGTRTTFLTIRNDLDPVAMKKWLDALDSAYEFYFNSTNFNIGNSSVSSSGSKQLFSVVNGTCGAGCGLIGGNGIEYLNYFFDFDYDLLKRDGTINHIPFYEMGRNFWNYSNKLVFDSYGTESNVTGFAVYMRFKSMEYAKVKPGKFDGIEFEIFKANVLNMASLYVNNSTYTFENTFGANKGFKVNNQNLSSADLFASFCYKIEKEFSSPDFAQKVWKEVAKRPNALNRQDAIDNFVLATCAALNKNVTASFIGWKFPVSTNAINEAKKY